MVIRLKGGEVGAEKELRRRKGVIFFYPALDPDLSWMVLGTLEVYPLWATMEGLQSDPGDTKVTNSHSLYYNFMLFSWEPIGHNFKCRRDVTEKSTGL